ncbi:hypothetical protein C9374_001690 [Naegleria lovaniensis]|uniref:Late endosomal/lysosomal adaptor and MAPK and MTOR activator 5 n=1 Tax=Naegleria lovaniensis TaxID=51637 RepID=A0AA88GX88_NAELO|nr:uncharacterized protein C9374_001690 [Naegleria lovaniensis]KAG2387358.1 hypothetical protein C9374_001690 [Naegleria lovaniensis]
MDESVKQLNQQVQSQEEEILGYCCADNNGFCINSFGNLENNAEATSGYIRGILKRANRLALSNGQSNPVVVVECDSTKYILQSQDNANVCVVRKSSQNNLSSESEQEKE